jgi:acetone carboxylase gamma subunit
MVRYYGLYANAHRGKVKKASLSPSALRLVEDDLKRIASKGWAAMIRKVYEVDPMVCPKCGSRMKVVAFLTEYALMASMRAAVPCFYRSRPTGGRRERGILLSIL